MLIKTSFNGRGRPQKGFPLDAYPKIGKWRCVTLQECVEEQECAKYNFKMQIAPLYCKSHWSCFIHVLECTKESTSGIGMIKFDGVGDDT